MLNNDIKNLELTIKNLELTDELVERNSFLSQGSVEPYRKGAMDMARKKDFLSKMKENNITRWLNSISKEEFSEFFTIRLTDCDKCPAKRLCDERGSDDECEEVFYLWSIKERGEE